MKFEQPFDVIISASMLEHDPFYEHSLRKMLELLKEDGILMLSWGAAINEPHEFRTCPDFHVTKNPTAFHPLPAGRVLKLLDSWGVYVEEFRYERGMFPKVTNSMGEVALVAFKDAKYGTGERFIDKLIPEDDV
jgi:SAM-dependent methyltransferase